MGNTDDFRDRLPTAYRCGCEIVIKGGVWWRLKARCPEHDEPVRSVELEPLSTSDGPEFWVL